MSQSSPTASCSSSTNSESSSQAARRLCESQEPTILKEFFDEIADVKTALGLFLNNQPKTAEDCLRLKAADSLYHKHGLGCILFMKSLMTLDKADATEAMDLMAETQMIASSMRKKTGFLGSLFGGKDWFKNSTLVERHAALIYAEVVLMKALLSLFESSSSYFHLLKEALNIRNAHVVLKEAKRFIDKNYTKVQADDPSCISDPSLLDSHFVSGVSFGIGLFHLINSVLPPKIIKLVELAGFSANQMSGLALMTEGSRSAGIRNEFCKLVLLTYDTHLSSYIDLLAADLQRAHSVLQRSLENNPSSLLFNFYLGKYHSSMRNVEEAISIFEGTLAVETEWPKMKHLGYWELTLLCAASGDNQKALEYAGLLRQENSWSKAVYTYLEACILYEMDSSSPLVLAKMGQVDSLRRKIAGKSIPFEKFVARKARKYAAERRLCLPVLEFLMIVGGLRSMSLKKLELSLVSIGSARSLIENSAFIHKSDDLALLNLLEAIISSELDKLPAEAVCSIFESFFENAPLIQLDHYFLPLGYLEYGRYLLRKGLFEAAASSLDKGLKVKEGYSMQSFISVKLHNCRRLLQKQMKGEIESL